MNKTDLLQEKINLWTECFGDTREFASKLFALPDIITVTIDADGEISALANLIPVRLGSFEGCYVYGVCVAPARRGKGLFAEIMTLCGREARARGKSFLCLIPADAGLDEKYKDFGYTAKIALKGAESGENRIILRAGGFKALVRPDPEALPIYTHGRLKPLSDGVPRENLAFSDYMGER